MSRGSAGSLIPRGKLVLILTGLLINSIIFSASFTFFSSFNDFSKGYLGEEANSTVIYDQASNTVFTGKVPTHLASYILDIPGVIDTLPEILTAAVTLNNKVCSVRGISEGFFDTQKQSILEGVLIKPSSKGCLLGVRASRRLGLGIEDTIILRGTQSKTLNEYKVIGIFESKSPLDDEILLSLESARTLTNLKPSHATLIRVRHSDDVSSDTLSRIVSTSHNLYIKINSDYVFNTLVIVEAPNGQRIISRNVETPGWVNLSLPFGEYIVKVENKTQVIRLESDKRIRMKVDRDYKQLSIRTYDPISGKAVETEVRIISQSGYKRVIQVKKSGVTDLYLPVDKYSIKVKGNGIQRYRNITLIEDHETIFYLGLIPVNIIALDQMGSPLTNVEVKMKTQDKTYESYTDKKGYANFQLPEGEYNITVLSMKELLKVTAPRNIVFKIGEQAQGYELRIQVAWPNGTRLNGAMVQLTHDTWSSMGHTDSNGILVFENIPSGEIMINVEKGTNQVDEKISLTQDISLDLILPTLVNFEEMEVSPNWIRYLPQNLALGLSDTMFKNATRVLTSLMTSTLLTLATLFTLATSINSMDIIQNSVEESRTSLGVIRSLGGTRLETIIIYGRGLLKASMVVGLFGYLIGFGLITIASRLQLLTLAGYTLESRISYRLLIAATLMCPLLTGATLLVKIWALLKWSPMRLLKGLRSKDVLYLPRHLKYPLLALLIPLLVRAIPEILVWPHSIGYDTISSYIPALVAIKTGFENQVYDFLYQRPFFWIVASLPYPFDGVLPFKFLPVMLHGLLGLSIYMYSLETMGERWKALCVSLLGTLYFIPLRISWDLFGNEMGLILVFLSLTLLHRGIKGWGDGALTILVITATVLTHEAASMILFLTSIPSFIQAIRKRDKRSLIKLALVIIPPLVFFAIRLKTLDFPLMMNPTSFRYPSQSYTMIFKSVTTLYFYALLPLMPLALIGLGSRSSAMLTWFIGASLAGLSPLINPNRSISFWDRWVYMAAYPLCYLAINGLTKLQNYDLILRIGKPWKTDMGRIAATIFTALILLISSSFLISTPGEYQAYHKLYGKDNLWIVRFVPSSMLLSTIPPSWADEAISHIQWLNQNITEVSVLFVDEELRGYAAYYIDMDNIILRDLGNPWYSNPDYKQDVANVAKSTNEKGYPVYLIARHFPFKGYDTIKTGRYLNIYIYTGE